LPAADSFSKTWTYFEEKWHDGNVPIMGPRTHAAWLCSMVFDGARYFEGVTPDLDLHCARVNESAVKLYLKPVVTTETWIKLAKEGISRFDPFRRPTIETMPVDAKAGCLYPNNARALFDVHARGFDNAIVLDMLGNVAELATSNIFMAKDGVVFTPIVNGTFLAGITRQRVVSLLRENGVTVIEKTLKYGDFETADEIFSTGNYSKVAPVTKIDARPIPVGPFYTKARELYWAFAHS
jgi:branched-chain amino acid aminotransferase